MAACTKIENSVVPTSISRSTVGSMELGRFVAAITIKCEPFFMSTIRVNNCETIRSSTSSWVLSFFGDIASTSSTQQLISTWFQGH